MARTHWLRVHYEAMAAGLPIVTTERGGNAEVIQLGENGLIVENPEDPANFVEKISEVLSNKVWMKKMGGAGENLPLHFTNGIELLLRLLKYGKTPNK